MQVLLQRRFIFHRMLYLSFLSLSRFVTHRDEWNTARSPIRTAAVARGLKTENCRTLSVGRVLTRTTDSPPMWTNTPPPQTERLCSRSNGHRICWVRWLPLHTWAPSPPPVRGGICGWLDKWRIERSRDLWPLPCLSCRRQKGTHSLPECFSLWKSWLKKTCDPKYQHLN